MLDDRQTTLFGHVAPPSTAYPAREVFREIDGKAGVYAGVEARYLDRFILRALRYDNRADPTTRDPVTPGYSWLTTFDSVGARTETASGWTAIVQWLKGQTTVEPRANLPLGYPFDARFVLISKRTGKHTLSARYDKFEVLTHFTTETGDNYAQYGHAWTVAYIFEPSAHWRFALEWLEVTTDSSLREGYFSGAEVLSERKLEASFRYALGSAVK